MGEITQQHLSKQIVINSNYDDAVSENLVFSVVV